MIKITWEKDPSPVWISSYTACVRGKRIATLTQGGTDKHTYALWLGGYAEIDTECLSLPAAKKRAAYILRRLFELFNQEN